MNDLLYYLAPLAATILIEEAAAWIMNVRQREDQLLILLVNIVTNLTLNMVYSLLYVKLKDTATWLAYLIGEPAVVAVEYWYFRKYLKTDTDCLKLAVVLNVASALTGVIWNILS